MASRMVLGIAEDVSAELERLAEKHRISKLEVVRRALALFMLIDKELEESPRGSRLAIADGEKVIIKIAI